MNHCIVIQKRIMSTKKSLEQKRGSISNERKLVTIGEPYAEGGSNKCPHPGCAGVISLITDARADRGNPVGVCLLCGLKVRYKNILFEHKRSKGRKGRGVRRTKGGNPTTERHLGKLKLSTLVLISTGGKKSKKSKAVEGEVIGEDIPLIA